MCFKVSQSKLKSMIPYGDKDEVIKRYKSVQNLITNSSNNLKGQFSFMTHNLLAPKFSEYHINNRNGEGLKEIFEPDNRFKLLNSLICSSLASVYAFQEVQKDSLHKIILHSSQKGSKIHENYNFVTQDKRWGNVTFYNTDCFRMTFYTPRSRTLISEFQFKEHPNYFLHVVNVHLEGSPELHHERFNQLKSCFKYLGRRKRKIHAYKSHYDNILKQEQKKKEEERKMKEKQDENGVSNGKSSNITPTKTGKKRIEEEFEKIEPWWNDNNNESPQIFTIICGDFNSSSSRGIYKMLVEGSLSKDYVDAHCSDFNDIPYIVGKNPRDFSHHYHFSSSSLSFLEKEPMTFCGGGPQSIDFVMIDDENSNKLEPMSMMEPYNPDHHDEIVKNLIPSQKYSSDHLPLFFQYAFE